MVRGSEILVVRAFQADDVLGSGDELDGPSGVFGGSVSVLSNGILVFLGEEILVVVAAETHRFGVEEQIHSRPVIVGIDLLKKMEEEGRGSD